MTKSHAPIVFPSEDDLAWLAGLSDAEGCFGLRRHPKRATQVLASAFVGMVDRRAVERAKRIAEALYAKKLKTHHRPPKGKSRHEFHSFTMVTKAPLYEYLKTILPYLRIKRTEALLQYDFLARAHKKRHVGTDHDFWLCEMSRALKEGEERGVEILARVRDDFGTCGSDLAWLGGYTDGDGSISIASGTKTICLGYGAASRSELSRARDMIAMLLGDVELPKITEDRSELSERPQWRLSLVAVDIVMPLLAMMRPHLFSKHLQADLAMVIRNTHDMRVRTEAIDLIHDRNHGRVAVETAEEFLAIHGSVAQQVRAPSS